MPKTIHTPTSQDLQAWSRQYHQFAERECTQDALYVAICHAVADTPELLALMQYAPGKQRRPNLLLAAIHEMVLSGAPHELANYYPSVGGQRLPDENLAAQLLDFAHQHQTALIGRLQTRSTQTNETGRCAVLWPALQHIAGLTGRQDLALLDFGSSAGLNLGVDDYHYDYGVFNLGRPVAPQRPHIRCAWLGDALAPRADEPWRIVQRLGLDTAPINVHDDEAVRWLHACLWPHDIERALRLEQAVALARATKHQVRHAEDCVAAIAHWLDALPSKVQPVLFNSWVLAYFEADELARFRAEVNRLVLTHGLAWLSAESPSLRPEGLALPAAAPEVSAQSASLWSLVWRAADGRPQQQALAWSHPHGRWMQWVTQSKAAALPHSNSAR